MNQEERDIRLLEYWQGESLSPEEVREVENWLGEKVENRRYFEDLQREFLRQRWVMRERLVSRKGERRFRQVARKRAMLRRAVAVAACVSALLLAGGRVLLVDRRGEGCAIGRKRGDPSRFFQGTVVSFDGGRGGVGKGTEVVAGATGSCY